MNTDQSNRKASNQARAIVLAIVLVLFAAFFAWAFVSDDPEGDRPAPVTTTPPAPNQPASDTGTYTSPTGTVHTYQFLSGEAAAKFNTTNGSPADAHVAVYQPLLPRDDGVLVTAGLELFARSYGPDTRIDPTPKLITHNGVDLISFRGDGATYYMKLIKEDTGEIHTINYWRE